MSNELFKTVLFLPSQAAAETEATIVKWLVGEGNSFSKGQVLAEVESAKSTFEFEAPCDGTVVSLLLAEGMATPFEKPVITIETADRSFRQEIPSAVISMHDSPEMDIPVVAKKKGTSQGRTVSLLGIGSYLPERVVGNGELLIDHPDINEEYIFGVTGIRERHWAKPGEKPSDMALVASRKAIENSGLSPKDIDVIIVSTATPDVVMPSTACLLQEKLGLRGLPAFDINAACAGWVYGITLAKGMVAAGTGKNILVTGVEMQSRLLDKKDRGTYFLFGDGAGATVVSGTKDGHLIKNEILSADPAGIRMARREAPGYEIVRNGGKFDPWIRLDGRALFRFATQSFSTMIRELIIKSGWEPVDVRWVVPHQANGRILKAAAQKSGVPFERFYLNIDKVGNTSSASIPIALAEIERGLQKKDKIVFCTVGAGITVAGMSIEW
ncbi:MAG: beta-ketoacyl-ACP synthase 3 [Chitinispirillaceae bacterium]|nr:beta-ketoacyl-ACP synthase 3 [Chitinispirillaceae bacterium]